MLKVHLSLVIVVRLRVQNGLLCGYAITKEDAWHPRRRGSFYDEPASAIGTLAPRTSSSTHPLRGLEPQPFLVGSSEFRGCSPPSVRWRETDTRFRVTRPNRSFLAAGISRPRW